MSLSIQPQSLSKLSFVLTIMVLWIFLCVPTRSYSQNSQEKYDTRCNQCGHDNPQWIAEQKNGIVNYCEKCGALGMPELISNNNQNQADSSDDQSTDPFDDSTDSDIPWDVVIGAVVGAAVIAAIRKRLKNRKKAEKKTTSKTNRKEEEKSKHIIFFNLVRRASIFQNTKNRNFL